MMKNKEVREALSDSTSDKELEDLLKGVTITDDDDLDSLSKKQQKQIEKLVSYFDKKLTKVEKSAVEKATEDTRKKEDAEIAEFSANNPGMKDQNVVDLMQPLYNKGKPLAECYATACKGLGLDPTTGKEPVAEEETKKSEKKEAKSDDTKGKRTSAKSEMQDDDTSDKDEESPKLEPKTLDEALAANSAAFIAKNGNPFEKKD